MPSCRDSVRDRPMRNSACILALLSAAVAWPCAASGQESSDTTIFRMIAVGDVMPGTEFPDAGYLDPRLSNDAGPEAVLGPELVQVLRSGDVVFGNMEGVLPTYPAAKVTE